MVSSKYTLNPAGRLPYWFLDSEIHFNPGVTKQIDIDSLPEPARAVFQAAIDDGTLLKVDQSGRPIVVPKTKVQPVVTKPKTPDTLSVRDQVLPRTDDKEALVARAQEYMRNRKPNAEPPQPDLPVIDSSVPIVDRGEDDLGVSSLTDRRSPNFVQPKILEIANKMIKGSVNTIKREVSGQKGNLVPFFRALLTLEKAGRGISRTPRKSLVNWLQARLTKSMERNRGALAGYNNLVEEEHHKTIQVNLSTLEVVEEKDAPPSQPIA